MPWDINHYASLSLYISQNKIQRQEQKLQRRYTKWANKNVQWSKQMNIQRIHRGALPVSLPQTWAFLSPPFTKRKKSQNKLTPLDTVVGFRRNEMPFSSKCLLGTKKKLYHLFSLIIKNKKPWWDTFSYTFSRVLSDWLLRLWATEKTLKAALQWQPRLLRCCYIQRINYTRAHTQTHYASDYVHMQSKTWVQARRRNDFVHDSQATDLHLVAERN